MGYHGSNIALNTTKLVLYWYRINLITDQMKQKLRQYIKDNPNCTKSMAAKYMDSLENESLRLSRISAFNLIDEFESKGIIKIKKSVRTGQSYHLIINDKNALNTIDSWISKTDNLGDITFRGLDTAGQSLTKYHSQNTEPPQELLELITLLRIILDIVSAVTDVLLIETFRKIKFPEDREKLSIKIISLKVRTLNYTLMPRPHLPVIKYLGFIDAKKLTEPVKMIAREMGIDIDNLTNYVRKFDDFENQFLTK